MIRHEVHSSLLDACLVSPEAGMSAVQDLQHVGYDETDRRLIGKAMHVCAKNNADEGLLFVTPLEADQIEDWLLAQNIGKVLAVKSIFRRAQEGHMDGQ